MRPSTSSRFGGGFFARSAASIGGRRVDADARDPERRDRQQHPPRPAPELQHGPAALLGQRAIERGVARRVAHDAVERVVVAREHPFVFVGHGVGLSPAMPPGSDRYRRIYAVVSRVPKGRVATYGQVAMLAGLPRQARFVGYALHALPTDSDVPWHRVVNAAGKISLRADALGHDELQAQLLRREGVRFVNGAIPLARFRWQPRSRR